MNREQKVMAVVVGFCGLATIYLGADTIIEGQAYKRQFEAKSAEGRSRDSTWAVQAAKNDGRLSKEDAIRLDDISRTFKLNLKHPISSALAAEAKEAERKYAEKMWPINARKDYVRRCRVNSLEAGFNTKCSLQGKDSTTLYIENSIADDVFIYHFTKDGGHMRELHLMGFKKLVISDGFYTKFTREL